MSVYGKLNILSQLLLQSGPILPSASSLTKPNKINKMAALTDILEILLGIFGEVPSEGVWLVEGDFLLELKGRKSREGAVRGGVVG